jgi:hypothetical protein
LEASKYHETNLSRSELRKFFAQSLKETNTTNSLLEHSTFFFSDT